jgi:hypothetical protein
MILNPFTHSTQLLRDVTKSIILSAGLLAAVGCSKAPQSVSPASSPVAQSVAPPVSHNDATEVTPAAAQVAAPAQSEVVAQVSAPLPPPPPTVIPVGTRITVRLDTTLGSRSSNVGEQFSATLASAVRVKGMEVIVIQAPVVGKVVEAKAAGKFAGASSLGLRLESIADHHVSTTLYTQQIQGKGKRSAAVIGGTAIAGALLGGLAGHGRGALIGGAVGGGVGTLGAAETGNNRDIVVPAGTVLTFKLTKALTVDSVGAPQA